MELQEIQISLMRKVPLSLQLKIIFQESKAHLWFVVLGLASIICIIIMLFVGLYEYNVNDESPNVGGKITKIITNPKKDNLRIFYTYIANDFNYTNYFDTKDDEFLDSKNDSVWVYYSLSNPVIAYPEGYEQKGMSKYLFYFLAVIAFLVIFNRIYYEVGYSLRVIDLFKNGKSTWAKLDHTKVVKTDLWYNEEALQLTDYKGIAEENLPSRYIERVEVFFTFELENGNKFGIMEEKEYLFNPNETEKIVFYDPKKPHKAFFKDVIFANIQLKNDDTFEIPDFKEILPHITVPTVGTLLFLVFLLLTFFK